VQSGTQQSNVMSRNEHNFANDPQCKHCHSHKVKRWGHQNGRQRYHCDTCQRTFNAFTGTPLSHLRVTGVLDLYVDCMVTSMTLRPAARKCGVSLETSFRLRHRVMEIIEGDKPERLQGIVEMDETFFRESLKGQRKLPRPARKRGGLKSRPQRKLSGLTRKKNPGIKHQQTKQIPVWVACDRQGKVTDAVLKHISADELCDQLNHRIDPQTPLVADAHLAHEAVAAKLNVVLKELVSSKTVIEKVFHIQHVNAYHSTLKVWINGSFRGVATKYLYRYLGWRRFLSGNALTNMIFMERIAGYWV
jgi:transposase-like protein